MVTIRKGKIEDFKKLRWAWEGFDQSLESCIEGIEKNNQDFLVAEKGEILVGELHIFWDHIDKEIANGFTRAYLSTFRVHSDYQGRGIGRLLYKVSLEHILKLGYCEVTIGGYSNELETQELYRRWGFDSPIKKSIDESSGEKREYILFLKKLM